MNVGSMGRSKNQKQGKKPKPQKYERKEVPKRRNKAHGFEERMKARAEAKAKAEAEAKAKAKPKAEAKPKADGN